MVSHEIRTLWAEQRDRIVELFAGCVQLFSDKSAAMLKSTMLVAYSFRVVHLKVSHRRREWLAGNEHKLVRCSPVSRCGEELEDAGSGEDENVSCMNLHVLRWYYGRSVYELLQIRREGSEG